MDQLQDIKDMVKAIDGDFTAQSFGYEMNGQVVVKDLKWLIQEVDRLRVIEQAYAGLKKAIPTVRKRF